jgi:putative long chain acyl-CoA synthase
VVEFYASTEAGAILVNLRGAKRGSMGRPLPGSAEVRIARYDVESEGLVLGEDGFARECGADEVGMLVARVSPGEPLSTLPLQGLFARDDAWLVTGDLFRRDADGDYWRVDGVAETIRTTRGPVFAGAIRDALGDLPAVDLAVAYGVLPPDGEHEVAMAAVTLRQGRELTARDLDSALSSFAPSGRPSVVRLVEEIPVTTWSRPITAPLREEGIPEPSARTRAWYLHRSGHYRPLTDAAHRRLVRQAA